MMKHNDQIQPTNVTPTNPRTSALDQSPISPALLIFGAWIAGTLMFEISALDDIGSRSASQHWGSNATMLQQWTPQDTRFQAKGFTTQQRDTTELDHVVLPGTKTVAFADDQDLSNALVVTAGSEAKEAPATVAIQLSSHQMDSRRSEHFRWMDLQAIDAAKVDVRSSDQTDLRKSRVLN
jgi:hypothetical protein